MVHQHPVELLGHRAVERAHARLHVRDRQPQPGPRRARPPAWSSCPRRRSRARAAPRPGSARARPGCAPSGRVFEPETACSWWSGAGTPSSSKNTRESSSSWCWPVWTISSSCRSRRRRDTAAAFTNWGRFPTIVTIGTPAPGSDLGCPRDGPQALRRRIRAGGGCGPPRRLVRLPSDAGPPARPRLAAELFLDALPERATAPRGCARPPRSSMSSTATIGCTSRVVEARNASPASRAGRRGCSAAPPRPPRPSPAGG